MILNKKLIYIFFWNFYKFIIFFMFIYKNIFSLSKLLFKFQLTIMIPLNAFKAINDISDM